MPSFRWVTTIYCRSRLDGHNKLNAGHGKAFTWAWIWRTTVWFHDLRNTNPGYTLPRCKWTFYQVYLQNEISDLLNGENPWHLPSLTKQGIDSTENQIHAQLREVELPIATAGSSISGSKDFRLESGPFAHNSRATGTLCNIEYQNCCFQCYFD